MENVVMFLYRVSCPLKRDITQVQVMKKYRRNFTAFGGQNGYADMHKTSMSDMHCRQSFVRDKYEQDVQTALHCIEFETNCPKHEQVFIFTLVELGVAAGQA